MDFKHWYSPPRLFLLFFAPTLANIVSRRRQCSRRIIWQKALLVRSWPCFQALQNVAIPSTSCATSRLSSHVPPLCFCIRWRNSASIPRNGIQRSVAKSTHCPGEGMFMPTWRQYITKWHRFLKDTHDNQTVSALWTVSSTLNSLGYSRQVPTKPSACLRNKDTDSLCMVGGNGTCT